MEQKSKIEKERNVEQSQRQLTVGRCLDNYFVWIELVIEATVNFLQQDTNTLLTFSFLLRDLTEGSLIALVESYYSFSIEFFDLNLNLESNVKIVKI